MPKKKPIDKRLKKLFEDIKPEQAPAEFQPAARNRGTEEKPLPPSEVRRAIHVRRPAELVTPVSQPDSALSLAFQAGQDSWATLQVFDEKDQRQWTQDEQLLVKQVADQLSLALENARLFQETQARAEELSVLNEMARELSTKLEVSAIADVVHRYTSRLMDTSNFYFALYDEKQEEKSYPLAFENGRQIRLEPSKLGNGGLSDYIIRTQKAIFAPDNVPDVMKTLGIAFVPLDEDDTPSQCWLGVPMLMGERVLGLISVQNVEKARVYDEHDRDILTTIASQAAISIENARLFEEIQLRADETARLNNLVTKVSETLDMQKNLQIIADEIASFTSALHVGIALIDREQKVLVLAADAPFSEEQNDIGIQIPIIGNPTAEPVIKNRQPLFLNDTFHHPATAAIAEILRMRGTQSLFIWPITVGRDVIGTLGIDFAEPDYQLPENHKNLINTILFQTSTSIQNARLFQETQDSEGELRALFASMNDVIIVYDKEGYYVRIAPTNPSLLIRPPEEMVGKNIREILPAELVGQFMAVIHEALKTNEVIKIEYPLTIAGNPLWFDANVSKLNEDQVFWVARDITERKLSEEAIRESDARTRLILETAIDGFITIDSHSVITEWNPQATQIFGWSREEAVGRTLADVIIPETYREAHKRGLEHYLATGEGPVLNQRIEITGLHRDGYLFPIELAITSIPGAGKSTFSAFVRDITERKRSEEAIRRQNEYLAVSAEIGRLVTSTLDLNTIFSRTVSLISERFGFYHSSIFTIEETGFYAVLREATGEAGEKMKVAKHSLAVGSGSIVGKAANSGEPVVVNNVEQEPLHRPNPLLLDTLSEAAIPLRIGPRIVGVIDIQSTQTNAFTPDDISVLQSLADQIAIAIDNARSYELSQQLIHDLREIDLLKSQFLANMSHELRTPLNSIIGFSRVILKGIDGPVTEMQQQDLTAIYNSGQHLLGLINDILDLARIEAGKMELNFEEVHLAEMATSVMSTAKGLVKEKPIQLLQRIPANMPTVRGDTMRVRQVLLNLISNAAKFTESGSITIETLVQKGPTGKMEALINVIDTGPGISAEDQKKLFQAFSQVDGSATRKTGGTGLGLSICANLVQLHGGRIGIRSDVGKSSTFWFTLPLYHQPEEQVPEGKRVVLAIDDDPHVIGLYERYLSPEGYYVIPLTDPLKAKEQIQKFKPSAITLDIMMPNKDGWSILADLKSDPATRDIPVIICSILEQADRGFSLGAADYLVKPILEEDLVHALNRLNTNGTIREVLVIDDDPNDLRLIEKILGQHGHYKPVLAQGGRQGWDAINAKMPDAIILDLFMPGMDGFNILERLGESPPLRDIPVLVVSGGGLTNEQQEQLKIFGKRLIAKGSLNEGQLIASIENALKRLGS